jgi:integrase
LEAAFDWLFLRGAEGWGNATMAKHKEHRGYLTEWFQAQNPPVTMMAEINYELLCRYRDSEKQRGMSTPTIRHRLGTLKQALDEQWKRGVIDEVPPWPKLVDTRPKRKKRAPTLAEYNAVRPHIPAHHLTWYDVAYWCGMRKLDVAGSRRYHFDLVNKDWLRRSTKTKAVPEIFPMPPRLHGLLTKAFELGAYGDTDRVCGDWPNAARDIGRACETAGVPRFTVNDLRRGCEARLMAEGHPPAWVRLWLCHSEKVGQRYYDAINDDVRAEIRAKLR